MEVVRRAKQLTAEAGRAAEAGRDVQSISAHIAWRALARGLVDELQVFLAVVMPGDGTRAFEVLGCRWTGGSWQGRSPAPRWGFGRLYRQR